MLFDFHLHPSLKAQMAEAASRPTPWEEIKIGFKNPTLLTRILKCQGINEVIDTQASLDYLFDAGVKLFGLVLHPPESAMMQDALIVKLAEQEQTDHIHLSRIKEIASGNAYFKWLEEEIENLEINAADNGRRLKILRDISDFDEGDENVIYAVLILEGPHAFWGPRENKASNADWQQFWENFESFTAKHRIFALNLAHLQPNEFCNHAHGIQIFKPKPFYPVSKGISENGFVMLKRMEEKKILADIKHMSLFARTELYDYRKNSAELPVICTHAGLTGISMKERGKFRHHSKSLAGSFLEVKHRKPSGYLAGTGFNASTINLYDEDVMQVVHSGGIIGLSMDQRILGLPDNLMLREDYIDDFFDTEVISPEEKAFYLDYSDGVMSENYLDYDDVSLEDRQNYLRLHARHFFNNLLHFFVIAERNHFNKAVILDSICLGSDFDGLINPIDCCRNVKQYPAFKDYLRSQFSDWEKEAHQATGFRLSSFVSASTLVDKVFYENGKRFLSRWLKR